jgi:hypothetical protein
MLFVHHQTEELAVNLEWSALMSQDVLWNVQEGFFTNVDNLPPFLETTWIPVLARRQEKPDESDRGFIDFA